MKAIKCKTIDKQYESHRSAYADNNERGKKAILFAMAGEQWDQSVGTGRTAQNKENLTFNLCLSYLQRIMAQAKEIEFNLNLAATNKETQANVSENNTLRMLLSNILLGRQTLQIFSNALDKCAQYGYAFTEVNYARENDSTLNMLPTIRLHQDPSIAFWDKSAQKPTKIDGRFCGMRKDISREEFCQRYPKYGKDVSSWLKESANDLTDYWFRDWYEAEYVRLKTGVFKRIDLITKADESLLASKKDVVSQEDKALIKKDMASCIYFQRTCNDKVIVNPFKFPTDDLPLVKHPGLTVWVPETSEKTFPYIHHLMGAQKLFNYLCSQIGTIAKNCTADKYFFKPEHVMTETQRLDAEQINTKEGGFIFGGDPATIRREQPAELPLSMLQMSQATKQFMDEMSGAMMDSQNAQQKILSGVALDKITHNLTVVNASLMAAHVEFVQDNGLLVKQMLPRIVTEERVLLTANKDGSGESIIVNEDLGTGTLKNNIRDLNNNYNYDINAGPSSSMKKEATLHYLTSYYQADPTAAILTGDIFMRNAETPDAAELERRLASRVDPALIAFSQGKISQDQFKQAQNEAQQKQMQMQAEQAKNDPQVQSAMAIASAEHKKAANQQFDVQTKRQKAMADAQYNQDKINVQLAQLEQNASIEGAQKAIDMLHAQLAANQQVIDGLKDNADAEPTQEANVSTDSD